MNDFSSLPGFELLAKGVEDLRAGRESPEALLLAIGEPRLSRLGIDLPAHRLDRPEHRLYHLLARNDADTAHSRYNALIRRLVSFERAAERLASSGAGTDQRAATEPRSRSSSASSSRR